MRVVVPLVLLMLSAGLAGCTTPAERAGPGAGPTSGPARPDRPVGDVGNLSEPLFGGAIVRQDGAWLVAGGLDLSRMHMRPDAWRIDADGTARRLPDLAGDGTADWAFGQGQGDAVRLLGSTSQSGLCCAHVFGSGGAHADGDYERHEPKAALWDPATGAVAVTALAGCEERGAFKAVEAGGAVYLLGGRASFSTDEPARFDARDVLRLRADWTGCERTGATLPFAQAEFAFEHAGRILVVGLEPSATRLSAVWVSPANGTVWPAGLAFPGHLDYRGATLVRAPDAAYLVGVTGDVAATKTASRLLRIDPATASVTILQDVVPHRAFHAVAFWADRRIVLAGGAWTTGGGDWTPDLAVSLVDPSGQPATLRPPVARFTADVTDPANLVVSFDGSASSDPDGDVLAWRFEFPDTTVCYGEGRCYYDDGKHATHHYDAPGDHLVRLVVTDQDGLQGVQEQTIHVAAT